MRRSPLRLAVAAAITLFGCNALIDVKDIYLEEGPATGDGATDGNTTADGSADGASDGGVDAGPCVDTLTNPRHCGRCNHDCIGTATCTAGKCASVTLGAGLPEPIGIALDATYVYVATRGNGAIVRIPKAGGQADSIMTGHSGTTGVAVDGTTLFWSNASLGGDGTGAGYTGGVWRCTLPGCQATRQSLVQVGYTTHMDLRNGYVFYGSESDIRRMLPDGGGDRELATVNHAWSVATDSANAYYTSRQTSVYRVPVDGGIDETVGPLDSDLVGYITLDADRIYWAYGEASGKGHVFSALKTSPTTRTEYGDANVYSNGIAIDAINVYWSNDGNGNAGGPAGDGEVLTCPKAGCAPTGPVQLAAKLQYGGPVVTDDNAVYYVEFGSLGTATGKVSRVAKP